MMDDSTPERPIPNDMLTPETPVNYHHQNGGIDEHLLIPSALFRPWDTPESLSPTSSNAAPESISPTSSNIAPSESSSPTSSNLSSSSSSPEDSKSSSPPEHHSFPYQPEFSPPQSVYSPGGKCLFTIEPLLPASAPVQGVSLFNSGLQSKLDPLNFASGKETKTKKRKRKAERFQENSASPVLAKKHRGITKGDFPPCGVCGEESTGIHYGAAVCEGCKGFFRRRVVYRDVPALVCGSGGQCSVAGKGRIHCKLCRYNRCLQAGMKPSAIKQEVKLSGHLSFDEQVLRCHKETLTPVPAVFLARQHTENQHQTVATQWPPSADLGHLATPAPGPQDSLRFVQSLPGFARLSPQDQQFAHNTGILQVMLARLLSRFRPEVGAFLFPCGLFVYPAQLLSSLPELTVASLTTLALNFASRGLTNQELSLLSALLVCNPLSASELYKSTLHSISDKSSAVHLSALAMQISELSWTASTEQWTNITLHAPQVETSIV